MSNRTPKPTSKVQGGRHYPFLGQDVLLNIFTRCDPRTVGRVRCTSNTWRLNLSGQEFAKMNLKANEHRDDSVIIGYSYSSLTDRMRWGIQVNAGKGEEYHLRVPVEFEAGGYFTIVGSDNGNLCVKYSINAEEEELLVFNPLTGKAVHVDDESYKFRGYKVSLYAFGYLEDVSQYRVVYLYKHMYEDKQIFWKLWNSLDGYWKTNGIYISEIGKIGPVSVVIGGVVYWIGWGGFFNLQPTHLLGFSLEEETFFEDIIPEHHTRHFNLITKINKSLGFIAYDDVGVKRELDVWTISRTEDNKCMWQKMYHVNDFGIPYTPSLLNGDEIISVLGSTTTTTGANDDQRTEILVSKIKTTGGLRKIIYHQGWQMSVFLKSITVHRDGLLDV